MGDEDYLIAEVPVESRWIGGHYSGRQVIFKQIFSVTAVMPGGS
jgi:hypothetical protein